MPSYGLLTNPSNEILGETTIIREPRFCMLVMWLCDYVEGQNTVQVLDAFYSISSGYKHTFIPFDNLYVKPWS